LTYTIIVDQSPEEAFAAINNVRGWWSGEIEGSTALLGDEFTYRYKDVHCSKQRITESIPGSRVVWLVLDSYLSFVEAKTEWNGSKVIFEITAKNGKTEIVFTHVGLTSADQCFSACKKAWGSLINSSLRSLIATGKGQPFPKEPATRATATA
jgi:hypothetical protein